MDFELDVLGSPMMHYRKICYCRGQKVCPVFAWLETRQRQPLPCSEPRGHTTDNWPQQQTKMAHDQDIVAVDKHSLGDGAEKSTEELPELGALRDDIGNTTYLASALERETVAWRFDDQEMRASCR
jgi:hypothetical protein